LLRERCVSATGLDRFLEFFGNVDGHDLDLLAGRRIAPTRGMYSRCGRSPPILVCTNVAVLRTWLRCIARLSGTQRLVYSFLIRSIHCGDGVIDDAGFLGWGVSGNVAVNAQRSLDGLASRLGGFSFVSDQLAI
jgi:hypothetical protein